MSEKHLTELPWKTLIVKQGVKDIGLGKALSAYSNVEATKEPAKALEALKAVAELALKLKKANPAKEEVVAHLEQVVKEIKKTTPGLEAMVKTAAAATAGDAKTAVAAKPEEDEADDDKAAEALKKDLKNQMMSALAQVKMRAPGDDQEKEPKPQLKFMAYVAAKGSAVVVALKVGAATKKLLPDIAGVASGGKFVQGECIFEKNAHTFVLEQVPGGLAKKLAAALHAETGQKYKVRVRNTDGSMELDSDADVDPDAATAGGATGDPAALFNERLKALLPGIKAAAGTPAGGEAKLRASEAGVLARKKDFAQANRLLDQAAKLLTTAPEKIAATQPETPVARWTAVRSVAVAKLQDEIKVVVATKDPDAGMAELELRAVLKQLNGKMETQQQAAEMERYLKQDDVVASICKLAFDLKSPLLEVLTEITPRLSATD